MKTLFLAAAEAELLEVRDYYARHASPLVAHAFLNQVAHALERLAEHPQLGAPVSARLRILRIQRLIYRVTPDALVVHAIASQRRRPGHWRDRR